MEDFKQRYAVSDRLGGGVSGEIFRAFDKKNLKHVAMKFHKKSIEYASNYQEAEILKILKGQNSRYKNTVVNMFDSFKVDDQEVCVLQLLHCDLHRAECKYQKGFSLKMIASVGLQVCKALCLFEKVDLGEMGKTSLIHSDLKKDNIMFTDETFTTVKIVDFGSAFFQCEKHCRVVQNINYQAPEGFFLSNTEVTPAVDMWSVGVLLFNLFSKESLFNSETKEEQLANLVNAFGEPSIEMISGDPKMNRLFHRYGDELKLKPVYKEQATQYFTFGEMLARAARLPIHSNVETFLWMEMFSDLLHRIFQLDPKLRLKPREAIKHPFFKLVAMKSKKM